MTTGPWRARRIAHETEAIRAGVHPVSLILDLPVRLHAQASREATPTSGGGLACGSCRFRGGKTGVPPWCQRLGSPQIRQPDWWPACSEWRHRRRNPATAGAR